MLQSLTPFSDLVDLADMAPFGAEKHVFRWFRQKGKSNMDSCAQSLKNINLYLKAFSEIENLFTALSGSCNINNHLASGYLMMRLGSDKKYSI